MKRSVLVAAGTAVGVTAVVTYHTTRPSSGLSLAPSSASASSSNAPVKHGSSKQAASRGSTTTASRTTGGGSSGSTGTQSSTTGGSAAGGVTRAAVGQAVSYPYGDVQVKVIESGGRIKNISIVHFTVPDQQSGAIDQYAVPQLRQQVLSAQSAHINGVSGASYTSQAYAQSVQSAIDKLT
jgi:uncharacterized protein with FMN-binding domain